MTKLLSRLRTHETWHGPDGIITDLHAYLIVCSIIAFPFAFAWVAVVPVMLLESDQPDIGKLTLITLTGFSALLGAFALFDCLMRWRKASRKH